MYRSTINPIKTWFHIRSFEIDINPLSKRNNIRYLIRNKRDQHTIQPEDFLDSSIVLMANFPPIDNHPIPLISVFMTKYNFLPLLKTQPMDYRVVLDIDYQAREDYRLFVKCSMSKQSIDPKNKSKFMIKFIHDLPHIMA